MEVVAEILVARDCGIVHCGVSSQPSPPLAELAAEFGLAPDLASYREIDADSARWLAKSVLNQDMAYSAQIMSVARAAELADQFLAQFGTEGARFYTNGDFHESRRQKLTLSDVAWNPVTSATFDTGVLIIGLQYSGCLWVEDED